MSVTAFPLPLHRRVAQVMGLPISLALRGRHADDARTDETWERVLAVLHEADEVFSTYREDSIIRRLDRGEIDLSDCPGEVEEVLALAEQGRIASGGAFDVRRRGPDGRIRLDPSGVVKGWAVERAAAEIDLPDTDFCLSAGGDMVVRNRVVASPDWRVGIEDPHDTQRMVAVVPLRDGALATSGLSQRGDHIVDARTGVTPHDIASVTVVGESLTDVDIDATSAFALGREGVAWLRERGRRGVVVWWDGKIETFG